MKPQHKSLVSRSQISRTPQNKQSESFLNATSSQPSLSISKTLIEKLMKLEGSQKPVHHHTLSDAASKSPEGKKRLVKRKGSKGPSPGVNLSISRSKPNLQYPLNCKSTNPKAVSQVTTPTSQAQTRYTKEPSRNSIQPTPELVQKEQFGSEVIALEMRLTERLKELTKDSDVTNVFEAQFPLYREVFQEIIDRDKKFGTLLMKVKGFYEEWFKNCSQLQETTNAKLVTQYSDQLKTAKRKLQKYHEEKKLMLRKIEKLSKETLELGRKLDECEEDYERAREKLDFISNVDLEDMSMDENTWKYLVVENQSYHELFRKMQQEFKTAKEREEKLMELVQKMKDRGFPIEEMEKEMFPERNEDEEDHDSDDLEPLTNEPEKKMSKPKNVPRLHLEILQESPSDSKATSIPGHPDVLIQDQESDLNEESIGDESEYADSMMFEKKRRGTAL